MKTFENLLKSEESLLRSITKRGFLEPTEIQEKSIPFVLEGKDIVALASTGSGKTLAFASGILKAKKDYGIQGLILTPTRELAEQVTNELIKFSDENINILSIYGGVPINNQIRRLPSAEVVVGTPGRILDHIHKNTTDLRNLKMLVLDEADRMLDMGFINDVEEIISHCPKKRQTMLFSATIPNEIIDLSKKYMINPIEVNAEAHVDPKKLKQVYYDVPDNLKYSLLKHLLENEESKLVIIFCNTRRNVDFITKNLRSTKINAEPLHGGYSQEKRNKIMENFHQNNTHILIATDVAARGLHIDNVTHVYNYDIPPTLNEYIHRIGRTARAGNEGKVINILTSRDYDNFQAIMSSNFNIERLETPYIKREFIRYERPRRNIPLRHNQRNFPRRSRFDNKRTRINKNNSRKYEHDHRTEYKNRRDHNISRNQSRNRY